MAVHRPGTELSPETEPHQHLDLGLSASRTVRHKCLLFQPSSLRYFVMTAGAKTQTKEIYFLQPFSTLGSQTFPLSAVFLWMSSSVSMMHAHFSTQKWHLLQELLVSSSVLPTEPGAPCAQRQTHTCIQIHINTTLCLLSKAPRVLGSVPVTGKALDKY